MFREMVIRIILFFVDNIPDIINYLRVGRVKLINIYYNRVFALYVVSVISIFSKNQIVC